MTDVLCADEVRCQIKEYTLTVSTFAQQADGLLHRAIHGQ
jgi:hypothetical protein